MSVREGVRAYLSEQEVLRASLYVAGMLGLALLAMWPRGSLETALRTGAASDTFTVVAICFLLALLYLGARWGAEDYTANPAVQLHEYVTMTPVSLLSLVSGRLLVGLLHTLGYDDSAKPQAAKMATRQEKLLEQFLERTKK
jgi:hypothetical protein